MTAAKLDDADLRSCHIEGSKIGAKDLRGAIVAPAQSMQFAALLGIKIR